jgi:hypothetical protein
MGLITDQTDIGRPPASGDWYILETSTGTVKMDHARLTTFIQSLIPAPGGGGGGGGGGGASAAHLSKIYLVGTGAETQASTPGITDLGFHAVWRGGTPLTQYVGALPVPAGSYQPDEVAGIVRFGSPALAAGEVLLVIYDNSGIWRKFSYAAPAAGLTAFNVSGLGTSIFSQVWASMMPLTEYVGAGAIPAGSYRVNLATEEIELGDATINGEEFFVIFKS